MPNMRGGSSSQERAIHIFISSTFYDLREEREFLSTHTFPQLRKLCAARGVLFEEVDLRWGITQEEAESGELLPKCFTAIDRCRPYFIGILGERYGSTLDEIDDKLIESYPWLKNFEGCSITELEIQYGVLNNPKVSECAFFYFRDPTYVDRQHRDRRRLFREVPNEQDIQDYGFTEATQRANARTQKLESLKKRICDSGRPVHKNYRNPQSLGEVVLEDFTKVINKRFPPKRLRLPDSLRRESTEHEFFALSRTRVYIPRKEYFDRLNEHAKGTGPPLVILGKPGSGKSSLLANWVAGYKRSHPDEFVLIHFVGATADSTNWHLMLRRILGEIKRHFSIRQQMPSRLSDIREALASWPRLVEDRHSDSSCRLVIVIDALNQLEDRSGALNLMWLPTDLPENLRLVVSTLPGPPMKEVQKRNWPTLTVDPLEPEERMQLIAQYLHQYAKKLGPTQLQRILTVDQTANPLYLRVLLEELKVIGSYCELDTQIERYLVAKTPDNLLQLVLERWERDYDGPRPGLTRDAMSLLAAARERLPESELLELLGNHESPLPKDHWSPLFLAAEPFLADRSGRLGFFHDSLQKAIEDKYLSEPADRSVIHGRLADFYEERVEQLMGSAEIKEPTDFTVDEKRYMSEMFNQLILAYRPQQVRDICRNPEYWKLRFKADAELLEIGQQIEQLVLSLQSWDHLYVEDYVSPIIQNLLYVSPEWSGKLLLGLRNTRLLLEESEYPGIIAAKILGNFEKNLLNTDKLSGPAKPPVLSESGEPEQVFCRDCQKPMHKVRPGENPTAMLRERGVLRQTDSPSQRDDVWICLHCGFWTDGWLGSCPDCGLFGLNEFSSGYASFVLVCPTCGWEQQIG